MNPFAGLGGEVANKGSDDLDTFPLPATLTRSEERIQRALEPLSSNLEIDWIACSGTVGRVLQRLAMRVRWLELGLPDRVSSAAHTQQAVAALETEGIDLLLFVGGDGTARDILDALNEATPVLGVPAGVKMQSGVFAISPEAVSAIVLQLLNGELVDVREEEVRDIDERALRDGRVNSRYYGSVWVPSGGQFLQQVKSAEGLECEDLVQDDICAELVERIEPGTLYLIGAGTTTQKLLEQLGLEGSLLGVDALYDGALIATDLDSVNIETLFEEYSDVVVILSVTANQGSAIGRGNQQFNPSVLHRIKRQNIWLLASKTKLSQLKGRSLILDTNDPELDRRWSGYWQVITGYRDQVIYPVGYQDA